MSRRQPADAELPVMRDVVTRIDALGDLINDLMIFARPRPPHPTTFELRPLLLEAIAILRRDPANAALKVAIDGPDVTLTADADLIRATVLNLLLNSAQATGGQGSIAIAIEQRDQRCILKILDNGPGIPAELRGRVFEPFFTTKARGGGLGLPIARRTAELHGGTLTLTCPDTGGTVFTMTVLLRALAAVRPSEPPGYQTAKNYDSDPEEQRGPRDGLG
ncbi:MAG: HAMP domain-containing histidine kinase [Acidobacteria bacterium]|nr:HAMP domain-containing histidine kinase [Acidobacteriota bacterium]